MYYLKTYYRHEYNRNTASDVQQQSINLYLSRRDDVYGFKLIYVLKHFNKIKPPSISERIYKYCSPIDDEDVRLEILDTAGQVITLYTS